VRGYPVWQIIELRQKRLDCLEVVGAVRKRLHQRKRGVDENARVRHGENGPVECRVVQVRVGGKCLCVDRAMTS
jgi:hypothetical protein